MNLLLLLFCCFMWLQHLCSRDTFRKGKDISIVLPDTGRVSVVFRKAATTASFASAPIRFVLPAQPTMPNFSIDFIHRKTKEAVAEYVEYADSMKMNWATPGDGVPVAVTPGVNRYFRVKSGKQSFSSPVFTLVVPPAPDVSRISIDYINEKLLHLPMGAVWSFNGSGESFVVPVLTPLIPKENEQSLVAEIRCLATSTGFESDRRIIEITPRPLIRLADMNKLLSEGSFVPEVTTSIDSLRQHVYFKSSDEDIARIQDLRIYLQKEGECQITARLEATASGSCFSAVPVSARLSVIKEGGHNATYRVKNLVVVDGVNESLLTIEHNETENLGLILCDVTGKIVYRASPYMNNYTMEHLPAGTYYYILTQGARTVKKGFVELIK